MTNIAVAIASTGSFLTALIALIISLRQTRVRKYEIKRAYYCEVLQWFSDSTAILIKLRYLLQYSPGEYARQKDDLLSHLSSQIEIGRFYFPNKDYNYGAKKPLAYQGLRNVVLDFLVFSFNLFMRSDAANHLSDLEELQRKYTSIIFEILAPKEQIAEIYDITNMRYYKNQSIDDFLKANSKTPK